MVDRWKADTISRGSWDQTFHSRDMRILQVKVFNPFRTGSLYTSSIKDSDYIGYPHHFTSLWCLESCFCSPAQLPFHPNCLSHLLRGHRGVCLTSGSVLFAGFSWDSMTWFQRFLQQYTASRWSIVSCLAPQKCWPCDGGMLVKKFEHWTHQATERKKLSHTPDLCPVCEDFQRPRFNVNDPLIRQLPLQSLEPGHSPSPSQIDAWAIHITLHGWWSACFSPWSFEISFQEIAWKQPKSHETTQVSFGLD